MTPLDHARQIVALREKATQGGWYCVKNDAYQTSWLLRDKDRNTLAQFANWQNKSFEIKAEHNADFCLHAANHAAGIAAALIEAEAKLEEATRTLAWIGDKAVTDWDDPTVGEADAALEKLPSTYRESYIAFMRRASKLFEENTALRAKVDGMRRAWEACCAMEVASDE